MFGEEAKHSVSDYALLQRLHFLFQRLTMKFHGDLDVWQSYIVFARQTKSSNVLGRVFGRVIQLFPRKSESWLMAAAWEWEDNGSPSAARALLQRGLRLNPEDKQLWLAYHHMEVLFWVKVMERRRLLGIHAKQNESQDSVTRDDEDGTKKMQVELDKESLPEEESKEPVKTPSGDSAFFRGAIPWAIYQQAMRQFHHDKQIACSMAKVYVDAALRFPSVKDESLTAWRSIQTVMTTAYPDDVDGKCEFCELPVSVLPSLSKTKEQKLAEALKWSVAAYAQLMSASSQPQSVQQKLAQFSDGLRQRIVSTLSYSDPVKTQFLEALDALKDQQ